MELVRVNKDHEGITLVTLNRPEKRNALNIALMSHLCEAIETAVNDSAQRVVIIKGEGNVFCAGLDLSEAQDPEKTELSTHSVAKMLTTIQRCPCTTIAAVHGAAFAGGAGLMAACDFVVAEEMTLFGFPETRRGLIAAQVMALLIRQLNERDLKELLLFGETIDAKRALSMGLINRVSSQEKLMTDALHYAEQAILGAPQAATKTKQLMEELYPGSFADNLAHALEYHHEARKSEEAKEGIAAFLEKREPKWVCLKKDRL